MISINQLILRNMLNWCEELSTAELRATVAAFTNEQRFDTVCFIKHETGDLTELLIGQGIQAVANDCILL